MVALHTGKALLLPFAAGGSHVSMFSALPTAILILKTALFLDERNYYSLYLIVPSHHAVILASLQN